MNNKQRCDLTEAWVLELLLKVFGGGGRGKKMTLVKVDDAWVE